LSTLTAFVARDSLEAASRVANAEVISGTWVLQHVGNAEGLSYLANNGLATALNLAERNW
jgi:hypothetical protein